MRTKLILKGDCLQTAPLKVGRGKAPSKGGCVKGKGRDRSDQHAEADAGRGNSPLLQLLWGHWATTVAPQGVPCPAGQWKKLIASVSACGPQRSNTSSGWEQIESLHLDVWMPYISSQDNCCTTGRGVRMRSARTHTI